ncbi:MAG: DUF1697 domain-containing protein [Ardenticatenaceae bacterium]|nr:DUF1697 domain-containing protein [Ardenticatenaceae bacterium]MCB9442897.1 DUF1697 domain-containing protein [Ardenticatenaceae bacterium]
MNTIVALLRGINVGGNNKLPMRELVTVLAGLGLENIQTYIQSGNVVFQTDRVDLAELAVEMGTAVAQSHGFTPKIMLLEAHQLEDAIAANPYPQGESDPKSVHFYFLEAVPAAPDLAALEALKTEREQFQLIDDVFYLYAPDGIGRSKLAERVEKALGVSATARNWRTVSKIMAMIAG